MRLVPGGYDAALDTFRQIMPEAATAVVDNLLDCSRPWPVSRRLDWSRCGSRHFETPHVPVLPDVRCHASRWVFGGSDRGRQAQPGCFKKWMSGGRHGTRRVVWEMREPPL